MRVAVFAGYSGAGKTTLIERLIALLRARGLRVSVVKHAHHKFDIDRPGKDTYRHREAGAFEVVIASRHRLALMREFEHELELGVHQLIAELSGGVDWVLVEGFRASELPKIEVWRADAGKAALYPGDACVVAIATDSPERLPQATELPLLDLNDASAVADWLLTQGARFDYDPGRHHAG
ncbi:MAG TPA: molybdopterin-guanine dinucleotide biosynthesis protein B [Ottowia sp.]|mgnify:CR=1 FL=1|uniref:molybdopterin-guanine dinucleotide biosynthesis protein B n=1 Tax=Ottowia sp. TaxID=1898956 RepID=UPI002C64ABF3|nr:molybdopterin-guanine dinucleotide biosynthesis protein B [Ottowia sp.]HMN21531.1 molybdopterin-guanine dinucleotide biosynthesis protein B [Ottowia sp.]